MTAGPSATTGWPVSLPPSATAVAARTNEPRMDRIFRRRLIQAYHSMARLCATVYRLRRTVPYLQASPVTIRDATSATPGLRLTFTTGSGNRWSVNDGGAPGDDKRLLCGEFVATTRTPDAARPPGRRSRLPAIAARARLRGRHLTLTGGSSPVELPIAFDGGRCFRGQRPPIPR